ncbi:MAG: glucose 1-dehydrogenase [Betaproteobacteria bacterium]|nr:glucose 1-dehydrogenase [Betaproteobacteria bacterium]
MSPGAGDCRRLPGKVAIVTGGASGIGEATSRLFARNGAKVVIADIQDERGKMVAGEIVNAGGEAVFMHLDVANEAAWERVIGDTVQRYGRLDVLVNNAGMSGPKARERVEQVQRENWDAVMAVNATSVALSMKHAIPQMQRAGGGSIINISSIYGIVGSLAGGAVYHASKGAVRTLSKLAAVQYAACKIRVNSVHPGFVDSPMTAELHSSPGVREERVSLTPIGRIGTPEDIAWGNLYLASDESSFVTGAEFVIDGGMTAR